MINLASSIVSKSRTIGRRMFLLSTIKAVVLVGIFGRLAALQIAETNKYKTLSDKNRFREWRIAPPRGIVTDYFNKDIAKNQKVYQLHITPENTDEIEKLFNNRSKPPVFILGLFLSLAIFLDISETSIPL